MVVFFHFMKETELIRTKAVKQLTCVGRSVFIVTSYTLPESLYPNGAIALYILNTVLVSTRSASK